MTELGITRQFPPVEWESANLIGVSHLATAFEEMLNRTTWRSWMWRRQASRLT